MTIVLATSHFCISQGNVATVVATLPCEMQKSQFGCLQQRIHTG